MAGAVQVHRSGEVYSSATASTGLLGTEHLRAKNNNNNNQKKKKKNGLRKTHYLPSVLFGKFAGALPAYSGGKGNCPLNSFDFGKLMAEATRLESERKYASASMCRRMAIAAHFNKLQNTYMKPFKKITGEDMPDNPLGAFTRQVLHSNVNLFAPLKKLSAEETDSFSHLDASDHHRVYQTPWHKFEASPPSTRNGDDDIKSTGQLRKARAYNATFSFWNNSTEMKRVAHSYADQLSRQRN